MTTSKSRQPIKLLKSISFPTFQLYAKINNKKLDPELALKISVLETMLWLRKRFRELEIPSEIILPEPEDYEIVNKNDFKSFHINEGYVLDVVYIKECGIWSLRLIESDLGPEPGKRNQKRKPVPGRLFQTNIAFAIYNNQLECGFKTLCSEPEGTDVPCEVFRLAVVKSIVRNKLLGLEQIYPIIEEAHYVDNINKIRKLKKFINDKNRQMPLVIVVEHIPKVDLSRIENKFFNSDVRYQDLKNNMLYKESSKVTNNPKLSFDAKDIIKYRMGYAQFTIISKKAIEDYNRIMGTDYSVSEGDVRIVYPLKFDDNSELYKLDDIIANKDYFKNCLVDKLQNYPKGKNMEFGNVKFLNEARIIQQDQIIMKSNSKKEAIKANEIKLESIKQIYEENINNLQRELEEKNNRIAKLKHKNSLKEKELKNIDAKWQRKIEKQKNMYDEEIISLNNKIKRKERLLERPTKPEEVPSWVEKYFFDKLIFHKRAQELINKTPIFEIDMDLLCDAIEFLAYEYRNKVLGLISKEEMNDICSKKYDRPFTVGTSGNLSIYKYPKEYKIKYGKGFTGKSVEVALNMHLKVGNDNENLLRIYFFFDKTNKLIIVGSLPKHLPTISYK